MYAQTPNEAAAAAFGGCGFIWAGVGLAGAAPVEAADGGVTRASWPQTDAERQAIGLPKSLTWSLDAAPMLAELRSILLQKFKEDVYFAILVG